MPYKLLIHFLLLITIFQKTIACDFEGNLTIIKETFYDTTYFNFSIQKNMVRIDQKNTQKQVIQSIIINLDNEKITVLSPNYKLFTYIQSNYRNQDNLSNLSILPTQGYKIINGYKCYLWRVRDENLNSEISYWVYSSQYDFFQKVIRILNGTEDYSDLFYSYAQIENSRGIPILSVERTLVREEKSKITITNLSNRKVNPNIFVVPKDYKFMKK
jgi:hypothetical protein